MRWGDSTGLTSRRCGSTFHRSLSFAMFLMSLRQRQGDEGSSKGVEEGSVGGRDLSAVVLRGRVSSSNDYSS